eukprot:292402-Pleurochrysis_carterae.AAC.2
MLSLLLRRGQLDLPSCRRAPGGPSPGQPSVDSKQCPRRRGANPVGCTLSCVSRAPRLDGAVHG